MGIEDTRRSFGRGAACPRPGYLLTQRIEIRIKKQHSNHQYDGCSYYTHWLSPPALILFRGSKRIIGWSRLLSSETGHVDCVEILEPIRTGHPVCLITDCASLGTSDDCDEVGDDVQNHDNKVIVVMSRRPGAPAAGRRPRRAAASLAGHSCTGLVPLVAVPTGPPPEEEWASFDHRAWAAFPSHWHSRARRASGG